MLVPYTHYDFCEEYWEDYFGDNYASGDEGKEADYILRYGNHNMPWNGYNPDFYDEKKPIVAENVLLEYKLAFDSLMESVRGRKDRELSGK